MTYDKAKDEVFFYLSGQTREDRFSLVRAMKNVWSIGVIGMAMIVVGVLIAMFRMLEGGNRGGAILSFIVVVFGAVQAGVSLAKMHRRVRDVAVENMDKLQSISS